MRPDLVHILGDPLFSSKGVETSSSNGKKVDEMFKSVKPIDKETYDEEQKPKEDSQPKYPSLKIDNVENNDGNKPDVKPGLTMPLPVFDPCLTDGAM